MQATGFVSKFPQNTQSRNRMDKKILWLALMYNRYRTILTVNKNKVSYCKYMKFRLFFKKQCEDEHTGIRIVHVYPSPIPVLYKRQYFWLFVHLCSPWCFDRQNNLDIGETYLDLWPHHLTIVSDMWPLEISPNILFKALIFVIR